MDISIPRFVFNNDTVRNVKLEPWFVVAYGSEGGKSTLARIATTSGVGWACQSASWSTGLLHHVVAEEQCAALSDALYTRLCIVEGVFVQEELPLTPG